MTPEASFRQFVTVMVAILKQPTTVVASNGLALKVSNDYSQPLMQRYRDLEIHSNWLNSNILFKPENTKDLKYVFGLLWHDQKIALDIY